MRTIAFFVLSVAFFYGNAQASGVEDDFLQSLNEASEIATASKLNLDKTPATVTVLKESFIRQSGLKRLVDILPFIPGIETSMTSSGKKQIIVRGIKSAYRDKIKVLIDGVDVTNNLYSNQFYYYNFPLALVKRIEFTKSPDSILYGSNAFLGVLNIVTLDDLDENAISGYLSTCQSYEATYFQNFSQNAYKILLDAHYSISNPNLQAPKTMLIDLRSHGVSVFRSPQDAHTKERNQGVGIRVKKESYTFDMRIEDYTKEDFFGISRVPALKEDKDVELRYIYARFRYADYIKPDLKLEADIGYKNYLWDGAFRAFPYDIQPTDDPAKDLIFGGVIHESEYFFKNNFKYITNRHNLIFQIDAKYTKPYDMYYLQYIEALGNTQTPLNLGPNGEKLRGNNNILKEGIERKTYAAAIEDMITLRDDFSFVLGYRFDHYSDFGSNDSYKAGMVYNFSNNQTYKLLYNHSFRAPSWVELYAQTAAEFNGNPDIEPETIDMVEFQYLAKIFRNDKFKLNFYYGKNKKSIDRYYDMATGKRIYKNMGDVTLKGLELSYKKIFANNELYLAWSHNVNDSSYNPWLGNRTDIFNGYFSYKYKKFASFTSLNYGDKIETPSYIGDIDALFSLNETLSYEGDGFLLQAGVINITDRKNYYWIQPTDLIYGRYMFVPEKAKVPQNGREFFISLRKSF